MAEVNLGRIGFVNKGRWNSSVDYKPNDVVKYGGSTYAAKRPNTGVTPPTDGTDTDDWFYFVNNSEYVDKGTNQEVTGVKNFKNGITTTKINGNKTIEGETTFIKSPIVPTPTTNFQVATKEYADTKQSKSELAYNVDTSSYIHNTLASGAIIEKGSNANGEYIKYADGTLMMYKDIDFLTPETFNGTVGSRYKIVNWTFPHTSVINSFVVPSGGQNSINDATTGNILITSQRINSITATSASIIAREIRVSSGTTQVMASVVAIGRWK